MPEGGFHRAPPAKPSCKLSRAVVDSNKDGAKQVRPLLKPHRLRCSSWPSKAWLFGVASGRIALSESAGLGMHPLTVPGLTPLTAPFPSYHSPPPPEPSTA